jgi:1-deoxy-D-xylulose-5-phosphate reductoisomerase
MAIANAANEVAVAAFLAEEIGFGRIPAVIEETLARVPAVEPESLPVVEQADSDARAVAAALVAGESSGTMRYKV